MPDSDDPLRIAMVAPPWFDVPPPAYGGVEAVVADLVDDLAARGHEVTLIGAGKHLTRASRFIPLWPEPPSERLGDPFPEVVHAALVAEVLDDLDADVVHDHTLAGPLLGRGRRVPTIITVHGPVNGEEGEYYRALGDSVRMVAISEAQRAHAPGLSWAATVHNAIRPSTFPFRADKEEFVLVLIEAMACGTPVVALRRGSVPEIIVNGVTGIICDAPSQLPEAVGQ